MDITDGLETGLTMILNIFIKIFDILENIEFFGTNLLNFSITIIILGSVITILITTVKTRKIERVKK